MILKIIEEIDFITSKRNKQSGIKFNDDYFYFVEDLGNEYKLYGGTYYFYIKKNELKKYQDFLDTGNTFYLKTKIRIGDINKKLGYLDKEGRVV